MGSSLVKPSQRESRRRGVNATSANRGDAKNNRTSDGHKDEGYKVDALAGPVSNYCKPVTVISQNDTIKNVLLPSKVSSSFTKRKPYSSNRIPGVQCVPSSLDSEYVSPVLKKDFSTANTLEVNSKTSPLVLNNLSPATGTDDSPVSKLAFSGSPRKPLSRSRKFFPASCIGKRNETSEITVTSSEPPEERGEVKFKRTDKKVNIVEPEYDDQDVSRDARTPSPEFNDFENVIVTEPTTTLPCASISSPIDKYTFSKNSEIDEEDSFEAASVSKSENPAPVHQGELRCELNKEAKMSNTNLITDPVSNAVHSNGDVHPLDAGSKAKVEKKFILHCDNTHRDKLFAQGDLVTKTFDSYKKLNQGPICENSSTEKVRAIDCEEYSKTKTNLVVNLAAEEQRLPMYIRKQENDPSKDCGSCLGSKSPNDDCLAELEQKKGHADETNEYLCASVKLDTKALPELSGLQGCATGATKCFCDVNQFDYDNTDDLYKSIAPRFPRNISDSDEVNDIKTKNIETEGTIDYSRRTEKTDIFTGSQLSKDKHLDNSSILFISGPNKSETNIPTQPRMSRLNCWRPDSGNCSPGILDKVKRQKCEQRPASWSNINSKHQPKGISQPTVRPCSAATGDSVWEFANTFNTALALASTSSSALDVSPSPSNSSLPRRQRSHASTDNEKSGHSDVNNESLKAQSTHDLVKPFSGHNLTEEKVHTSRPTSARSSHTLAVDITEKLSQHSLPRLSARGSGHNMSRSLSNHSSGCNLMHCPRPPSCELPRHSPRPSSGRSEKGGTRRVTSRHSYVQLSESGNINLKQFSNHSLSLEPIQKPTSQQNSNQMLYSSNREGDASSSKNPLTTSQVKLPPIRTTTNFGQSAESMPPLSQPLKLPPVISVGSAGPLCQSGERSLPTRDLAAGERSLPTEDLEAVGAWRKPCNFRGPSLPPVTGREAPSSEGTYDAAEHSISNLSTCVDVKAQEADYVSLAPVNKTTPNENPNTTVGLPLLSGACSLSAQENNFIHEKSEHADSKPSPNNSSISNGKISSSCSLTNRSTSDELARIMAKYSTPAETKPVDISNDICLVSPINECNKQVNTSSDNKQTQLENDEAGALKNPDKYFENAGDFSGFYTEDGADHSKEQKYDSTELLRGINEKCSYIPSNLPEDIVKSIDIEQTNEEKQDNEATKDVSKGETPAENKLMSSTFTDSKDPLASSPGSEKRGYCTFGTAKTYSTSKNESFENFSGVSETTADCKSNSTEPFDYRSILEKYSIGSCNVQSDVETSRYKSETADEDNPISATNKPGGSQLSTSEYLSNILSNNSIECTNTSKQTSDIPDEIGRHAGEPNDSFQESKPSSMFDVENIIAKYTAAKSEDTSNLSSSPLTGNKLETNNVKSENENIVSASGDGESSNTYNACEGDLDCNTPSVAKMDGFSMEGKPCSVEENHFENSGKALNVEENNGANELTKQDNHGRILDCSTNDQCNFSKDIHDSNCPDELKAGAPKEKEGMSMYGRLGDDTVEKLDSELCPLNGSTDYMADLSHKLSSFGERVADISSLTEHYQSTCGKVNVDEVMNYKVPTITNVMPVEATDDKMNEGKRDGTEELQEPPADNVCASTKIEPGGLDSSEEKIETPLETTDVGSSLTSKLGTANLDIENHQLDEKTESELGEGIQNNNNEEISSNPDYGSAPLEKPEPLKEEESKLFSDEAPASEAVYNALQNEHKLSMGDQKTSTDSDLFSQVIGPNPEDPEGDKVLNGDDNVRTDDYESNKLKTDEMGTNDQQASDDLKFADDFLHSDINNGAKLEETNTTSIQGKLYPFDSQSCTAEDILETNVPELLPSERIDTIKKQIYEEGLKPCQRDGGVAFFIPVSNTGLQPPVTNPDIEGRLAKPKKPSMSYEERMMMADINRQEQLSKKKEFAVKDLINVKSATASNSSTSGENISGGGQHDRSDRSDSGSLH
ncbi:hypothetical protein ElyMa_003555100 [Elysia marginata]|uniref:Uncharacterized protein n=1 Tax=Elysia marginata TaxID=1093978 RepID=A0AAV4EL81_9GAST|nr:hypothetical protein ElyMa_003555100 [Elysia marginata]